MNRKELVDAISDRTGLTKKDADSFLGAFVDSVVEELKSGVRAPFRQKLFFRRDYTRLAGVVALSGP